MKKVALTIGDPAGVGPEIALKAIMSHEIAELCEPVIIGDTAVLDETVEKLNIPVDLNNLKIINTGEIKDRNFQRCKPTAEGGRACASYIKRAIELALDKEVDAVVTAPISKESLKMAGFKWPGHTEMLAELTTTKEYAMMFYSDKLKVILVTIHTAFKNVSGLIKKEKVLKTIILAKKSCDMMA